MLRCIIIEDQPPAQRVLQKYIGDVDYLELRATFSDAIEAVDFLKSEVIDLIFLDIHLPKISGIDFLKTLANKPYIILTTAFPDYALESYEHDVVDYLLKPFSFQRFIKAVVKVPQRDKDTSKSDNHHGSFRDPDVIFIKSGYEHIKVAISEIRYIKSEADYTEIFTVDRKHLTSHPLKYWLERLEQIDFVQIHKSFVVNTSKIVKVSGNRVYFDKETMVPIGRAYKEHFVEKYLK
jgi:DNA-binding LytR/AlgR family response regulator